MYTGFSLDFGIYCSYKKSLSVVTAEISWQNLPYSLFSPVPSLCVAFRESALLFSLWRHSCDMCVHTTCFSSLRTCMKWKILSLFFTCFGGRWRRALQNSSWKQNIGRYIFNSKYYSQVLKYILKLPIIKLAGLLQLGYSWGPLDLHFAETMAGLDFQVFLYLFLMLSKT